MDNIRFFEKNSILFSFFLLFALPIFPTNVKPLVIIFFSLIFIISIIKQRKLVFYSKYFFINASLYLFLVFSLIYSTNVSYGLKKIETMASLIIFPLIFSFLPKSYTVKINNNKDKYLFTYIISIVVLNILFFFYHLGHYKETIFEHYITLIRIAQGDYSIHPIYMSMHISVSLLFSIFLFFESKGLKRKLFILLLDTILLFFLFLLLKKGPIIGLFLAMFTFVILKRKKHIWLLFLFVVTICLGLVFTNSKIKKKFSELVKIETIDKSEANITSTNIRYSLYHFGIETFKKSPIIGHGIGDYREKLIASYKTNSILFRKGYNSHNQYISFLISLGCVGVLLFFLILAVNFIEAKRNSNDILIVLLVFYCFVMLTENILEREDGVLYFSLFLCFFSRVFQQKQSTINS